MAGGGGRACRGLLLRNGPRAVARATRLGRRVLAATLLQPGVPPDARTMPRPGPWTVGSVCAVRRSIFWGSGRPVLRRRVRTPCPAPNTVDHRGLGSVSGRLRSGLLRLAQSFQLAKISRRTRAGVPCRPPTHRRHRGHHLEGGAARVVRMRRPQRALSAPGGWGCSLFPVSCSLLPGGWEGNPESGPPRSLRLTHFDAPFSPRRSPRLPPFDNVGTSEAE